jgi:hypothetical protein
MEAIVDGRSSLEEIGLEVMKTTGEDPNHPIKHLNDA